MANDDLGRHAAPAHRRTPRAIVMALLAAFLVLVVLGAGRPTGMAQALAGVSILIVLGHALLALGVFDTIAFLAIALSAAFTIENVGVATGLPFGRYHFLVGASLPHLGTIPLIVGGLYFGMGYPAWIIAGILVRGADPAPRRIADLAAVGVIATFVMVQWDTVMDPSNATLGHLWVWHDGGAYFGVPVSNIFGWFSTVATIFALFAAYLAVRPERWRSRRPHATSFWLVPVMLYLAAALCVVPPELSRSGATAIDGAGQAWRVADIRGSAIVVMMSTMLATSVLALLRLWREASDRLS